MRSFLRSFVRVALLGTVLVAPPTVCVAIGEKPEAPGKGVPKPSAPPQDVMVRIGVGRNLRNQQKYHEALKVFNEVLAKAQGMKDRPSGASALNNIASVGGL